MNALFCALGKNEFNRVSTCEMTFDIWHTLEITHEGTSRVKDSKINLLMHDFNLFRMKPSETIGDMYTHFTNIINSLKALDKYFSNFELVNKILRSLSKNWDSKVTTIQEAKNLNTFSIEELIESLMTYEITNVAQNKHEYNLPKNRKDLALRTIEYHLSDDSSDDDDDLELYIIKLKKFLKEELNNTNELKKKKLLKNKKALEVI